MIVNSIHPSYSLIEARFTSYHENPLTRNLSCRPSTHLCTYHPEAYSIIKNTDPRYLLPQQCQMPESPPSSSTMSNNHADENPEIDLSNFQLLHEVFRHRAADPIQTNLMAFPKSGFADYEYFTGKILDRFTDAAAWHYAKVNLRTVRQNHWSTGPSHHQCQCLCVCMLDR